MRGLMVLARPLLVGVPRFVASLGHRHQRQRPDAQARPARLSTSTVNAVKLKKKQVYGNVITEEEREIISWWQLRMEMCRKPATREMIKLLVPTNLLGLDPNLRNGSLKEGSLNSELLEVKRRFPREVLLCRVGEFYEACGYDACILVEYTGLNPMGGSRADTVPRAGCPVMNLRQTLDQITKTGLSACVVEEVQAPIQGKQRKGRFISGHAHPGSPYIYGLAAAETDLDFPEPCLVVGISQSTRGYCFISVSEMMRTYSVEHELTEEAVVTKLRATQYQHLFLHRSLRENSADSVRWGSFGEGGLLWGECKGKLVEWYDQDPVSRLLAKVKELYDIDEAEDFREMVRPLVDKPRPVYMSTASQIGILVTPGIPSLLKVIVPADCSGLPVRYLRDLLLNPPPYDVATSIRNALQLMAAVKCSVPQFVSVPAGKLVKLIGAREVNHIEFSRIMALAEDVLYMYDREELRPIFELLLDPTGLATGLKIDSDCLINDCRSAIATISSVLCRDGDPEQELNRSEHLPDDFFYDMEFCWKGRVQRIHFEQSYKEVDVKAAELVEAIKDDFLPVLMRTKSMVPTSFGTGKAEICYAREHAAVWFKGKGFKPTFWDGEQLAEEEIKRLKPAVDSKGRKVGDDWHTSPRVESALESYRDAAFRANLAVVQTLRNLSDELKKQLNSIIFASVFCVIAKALLAHVSEGKRRGWTFSEFQQESSNSKLILTGLSPYWLDSTQDLVVRNSIDMSSMYLLTGPNGGGKSSLLRATCAAALLGLCGLMAPAQKAVIPKFDSIMLRVMSHDSPADAKSLFQMEMAELRTILTEATDKTLVLIDELCKGTEVQKGTCLLASALEKFGRLGCIGVVSTHLHGLLDLELDIKNVVYKAMGTKQVDGQLEPTWQLVDGKCRESLAFETARKEGIPDEVLQRARQLYDVWYGKNAGASLTSLGRAQTTELLSSNGMRPASDPPASSGTDVNSMKAVEEALMNVYKRMLKPVNTAAASCCGVVGARQQPPPFTTSHSCVYVLHRPDGRFYIGQTDNLAGRIASHRSCAALKQAEFLYLPVANKSVACQLETALITQLPAMGFSLVNKVDQNHRHFGVSPAPPPPF